MLDAIEDQIEKSIDPPKNDIPPILVTLIEIPSGSNHLDYLWKIVGRLNRSAYPKLLIFCKKKSFYAVAKVLLYLLKVDTTLLTRGLKEKPQAHGEEYVKNDLDVFSKSTEQSQYTVLRNCNVFLVPFENCHFEDVLSHNVTFDVCIAFEANRVTEPESLFPWAYSIRHLVLMGVPSVYCNTSKLTGGFKKSLFHRGYNNLKGKPNTSD